MYEQLALITSILGGFSFTFVGALITIKKEKRITEVVFTLGIITATLFLICALGWTMIAIGTEYPDLYKKQDLGIKHRQLSKIFIFGVVVLTSCIGLSGWIRSKKTGLLSTIVGVLSLVFILYFLSAFIS